MAFGNMCKKLIKRLLKPLYLPIEDILSREIEKLRQQIIRQEQLVEELNCKVDANFRFRMEMMDTIDERIWKAKKNILQTLDGRIWKAEQNVLNSIENKVWENEKHLLNNIERISCNQNVQISNIIAAGTLEHEVGSKSELSTQRRCFDQREYQRYIISKCILQEMLLVLKINTLFVGGDNGDAILCAANDLGIRGVTHDECCHINTAEKADMAVFLSDTLNEATEWSTDLILALCDCSDVILFHTRANNALWDDIGYLPVDIRPLIDEDARIDCIFRENITLYVKNQLYGTIDNAIIDRIKLRCLELGKNHFKDNNQLELKKKICFTNTDSLVSFDDIHEVRRSKVWQFPSIAAQVSSAENSRAHELDDTAWEKYAVEFALIPYQVDFLKQVLQIMDFKGKRVLEIGGSNMPREITIDLFGASKWVCIDKPYKINLQLSANHYKKTPMHSFGSVTLDESIEKCDYVIFEGYTDDMAPDFFNQFDLVISNCCFEHVIKFELALNNIYLALKKGGILYSKFGPIWSSMDGSHFTYSPTFKASQNAPLPKFAHLLLSYREIYDILNSLFNDDNLALQVAKDVKYGSFGVNRYFYEDYENAFEYSQFSEYCLRPSWTYPLDKVVQLELETRYPGYRRFDVYGIELYAVK